MSGKEDYIPAMGFYSLAALYDPLVGIFVREKAFKGRLVEQAGIVSGYKVLDLGCGTATLTIMIKESCQGAQVVGLDGDARILDIARSKRKKRGLDIQLDEGFSFDMPYPEDSFERVISSLVFHHLSEEDQVRTLAEVKRILKPGGQLHIADFAVFPGQKGHLAAHLFSHFHTDPKNDRPHLLTLMADGGFSAVRDHGRFFTIFGRIGFFSGVKGQE